jgi:hypothetical protein
VSIAPWCRSIIRPLAAGHHALSPASQKHDSYHCAALHPVALWCIAVGRRHSWIGVGRAPAPLDSGSSRNMRGYESACTWITLSYMDQNLCRRLMPRPKCGRSRPTTAPAAPAAFCLVRPQIVGSEQMAIAADAGYGRGLADTFQGKAHHISFGCSKARPRYQFQRFAPRCTGWPRRTAPSWQSTPR